jgi:hypothetical protein
MHSTGNARSFDCCAFSQRLVMSDPSNPRRPKRNSYRPSPETLALLKSSGNFNQRTRGGGGWMIRHQPAKGARWRPSRSRADVGVREVCRGSEWPLGRKMAGITARQNSLTNRSGCAHVWHTKRRRESKMCGVLEQVSLMTQISGLPIL